MDDTSTKARNIRAVLLTALYNSCQYNKQLLRNCYHFHLAEETRREWREWIENRKTEKSCRCECILLAAYVGGFFEILFLRSEVCLNPLQCSHAGCGTSSGRNGQWQPWHCFLALTVLVIWRGKDNPLYDERNFEIFDQGNHGTAVDLWEQQEQKEILQADRNGTNKRDYFWKGVV